MIFSIPRSKSLMEPYSYQKSNKMNEFKCHLPNQKRSFQFEKNFFEMDKKNSSESNFQANQKVPMKKLINSRKQLIYNDRMVKSFDKYIFEKRSQTYRSNRSPKINQTQQKSQEKSQQKLNISYGKKLIDPIHQKFNYFIRRTNNSPSPQFIISDFLLQPCKIKAKKLEARVFTSQDFIPKQRQNLTDRQNIEPKSQNQLFFQKKQVYKSPRTTKKKQVQKKHSKTFVEFTKQLYMNKNIKSRNKNFPVEPWQFDTLNPNMQSINQTQLK